MYLNRVFLYGYIHGNLVMSHSLSAPRHEWVSGHGFADFNKEVFEAFCGGQSPLEKMGPLLSQLQLKPEFSLFKLVQKGILGIAQENDQLLVQEVK